MESKLNLSPEEKLKKRLAMSHEERYKAALRMIRLVQKLKTETTIKHKP
ncbi:MAG: hypothetical protein K9H61_09545 [Bacteroidia bacterium]|nr:hypothetical protein [Bacteroidia bacterium]MCF8427342.1 hypothetical protein [Bacteroidia bacterium]MCF8447224.1 hypothetical protein [Bacteroidia bacterium]